MNLNGKPIVRFRFYRDSFEHIKKWANTNSMVLNLVKTKEIVFHRPNPRNFVKPAAMDTIEQLTVAKILGVFVHGALNVIIMLIFFCRYVLSEFIC